MTYVENFKKYNTTLDYTVINQGLLLLSSQQNVYFEFSVKYKFDMSQ